MTVQQTGEMQRKNMQQASKKNQSFAAQGQVPGTR